MVVRGYRIPSLTEELAGAVSLLQASGTQVRVHGDAHTLAPQYRELAAHVIRECTTNILRHARPTVVDIVFAPTQLTLTNDRPNEPRDPSGTGLASLAHRLDQAGTLNVIAEPTRFSVQACFDQHGEQIKERPS